MTSPAAAPTRRQRKKNQTRERIRDAAIALFLDRGFDAVTIAEISDAADVDPTTFWRHFKSKDATLFSDQDEWVEAFRTAFEAEDADQSILHTAIHALFASTRHIDQDFDRKRSLVLASSKDPGLEAALLSYQDQLREEVAFAVANRLNVDPEKDPRPTIFATTVLAGIRWMRTHPGAMHSRRSLDDKNFKMIEDAILGTAALMQDN